MQSSLKASSTSLMDERSVYTSSRKMFLTSRTEYNIPKIFFGFGLITLFDFRSLSTKLSSCSLSSVLLFSVCGGSALRVSSFFFDLRFFSSSSSNFLLERISRKFGITGFDQLLVTFSRASEVARFLFVTAKPSFSSFSIVWRYSNGQAIL